MAAVLIGLGATNAGAVSMGKLRVQSALGQSLVAEIDLADISEDEAGSLKSELAAPSTFTGMGLEYNTALNGTQIVLQRRPNGSRYLKVTGSRTLNDPFLDILVELSWGSGKIVRTYTILLDPPKSQDGTSAAVLPASVSESPVTPSKPIGQTSAAAATVPASAAPAATSPSPKSTANTSNAAAGASSASPRVKVHPGDNAGKIARAWISEGISVEQMLVAMLDANPSAFVDGNINRLMANTELRMPDATAVKKTSPADAQRLIQRQNQDFQNLRRTLAGQAPAIAEASKPAQATGKVTPGAPNPAPKTASGDTLKLSKSSPQDLAEKASMEQIAQQRAKNEASERARELAKNIEELNQLAKVAAKPEPVVASASSQAVASEPPKESAAGIAAPVASAASQPAAPSVVAAVSAPAKATAEGMIDSLMRNFETSALALALAGLIGGLGWYRWKQSRQQAGSRADGHLKWNSSSNTSFAAASAQRVDTADAHDSSLNSSLYQESQLEMANELDPVAEAEVYLAYGKDVPAEEILKEGLQQTPQRLAIHHKLLAIYAKRGDVSSFEKMAREVHELTQGNGSDWVQVLSMGLALDPTNPLYGAVASQATDSDPSNPVESFQHSTFVIEPGELQAFSKPSAGPSNGNPAPLDAAMVASLSLPIETGTPAAAAPSESSGTLPGMATDMPESAFATTERLDATLALAEQFLEIGEKEGARALIEEVLAGGNEALRKRATELLAQAK